MITTLVCIASLSQGKISLEVKAERLERAAPAIGRALGMEPLAISPTLRDEVLAFRCSDVSASDTQSKIESVLNASFIKRETGWSLEQTPEQQAQDVQRQRTYAYNKYAKLVERCQAQLAEQGPFDARAAAKLQNELKLISSREVSYDDDLFYNRLRRVELQSPTSKFALRVIGRLQAKDWMPLSRTRPKIVYSLNPTKMQVGVPFNIKDLTDQLLREQALWVDMYGTEPIPGPRFRELDGSLSKNISLGDANDLRQKYPADAFAHVVFTLYWNDSSVSVTTFNRQGEQSSHTYLDIVDVEQDLPPEPENDRHPNAFKFTEEQKLFLAAFRGDRTKVLNSPVPQKLIDQLLQPLIFDPLSLTAYPQVAHDAKEKNFALVLPDELVAEKGISFKTFAENKDRFKVIESEKWIEVQNLNALDARLDRLDRRVASRLFALVHNRKQDLTIEERASFIASQPVMRENEGYMHQVGTLLGKIGVRTFRDPASHRVYGMLSDSERASIARSPVAITSLSPAVRDVLNFEIFLRPYGTFAGTVALDYDSLTPAEKTEYDTQTTLIEAGILSEESFLLPRGLTGSETLSSSETKSVSLICGAPPGVVDGFGRVFSPESLGRFLAQKEFQQTKFSTVGIFEPDVNAIYLGDKRTILMKLRVSKFAEFSWTLTDTVVRQNQKFRLEELPSAILERVNAAQVLAKAEFERTKILGTSKKTSPPPR